MNIDAAKLEIGIAREALNRAERAITGDTQASTVVRAGDNLQAALEAGGVIDLEPGATFEGHFVAKSGTTIRGAATLRGKTGAALTFPPGRQDLAIIGPTFATGDGVDAVLQIGKNDSTQTRLEDVPANVILRDVTIPRHRGKRGISLHARGVLMENVSVLDVYDPAGQDSQALYILNSPGDIQVKGSQFSAGSECVIVGGDLPRIANLVPERIVFESTAIFRPIEWQTDGVARKVKNLFELKSGRHVIVRRCALHGCWAQGQEGEAFTITPALAGERKTPILPSGIVTDVLLEDNDVWNVGGGVAILGAAYNSYTAERLTGLVVRNNHFKISRKLFGGRGQLLTAGAGPGTVEFRGNDVQCDGSSTVYYYQGNVANQDGSLSLGGKMGKLAIVDNRIAVLGTYGFMLDGFANGRNWQTAIDVAEVTGNQFTGPATMRSVFPDNTYTPVVIG